jgi:Ala-tRNA(Pro) deacylase
MPAKALKEYLDREGVQYSSQPHSTAYTAQEVAASAHVPGWQFAKTVIVNINGNLAMVVLPANRKVALQDLRDITGDERVTLASEKEFAARFPDCEPGAMPPFGNLYGMDVFVAPELAEADEIVFNAGTHSEVLHMAYSDFDRLVHPRVASCTT